MTLHATRLHTNVRVTQVMKQLEQVEKELALARESVKCFSKKVVFFRNKDKQTANRRCSV